MALPTTIRVLNDGAARTVAGIVFAPGENWVELETVRALRQMGHLDESQMLRFRYDASGDLPLAAPIHIGFAVEADLTVVAP